MSNSNPRAFSREENEAAIFQKRLQSLPDDEQDVFRRHLHPCQERDFTGLVVARCCALALQGEIGHSRQVKRVEPGLDSDGFVLTVVVNNADWKWERYYRGYKIYQRVEFDGSTVSPPGQHTDETER